MLHYGKKLQKVMLHYGILKFYNFWLSEFHNGSRTKKNRFQQL